MASIRRQKSGRWRVQVRRKGRALSETFVRHEDAKVWAVEAEREIDRGESPRKSRISKLTTFGDLIELHIADMKEVGKAPGRSKDATLKMLTRVLGKRKLVELDRDRFIDFGKARAAEGAGPVTLSIDIGIIKLVLQHAAAVHGLRVSVEAVDLARYALKRLGLIGNPDECATPWGRSYQHGLSRSDTGGGTGRRPDLVQGPGVSAVLACGRKGSLWFATVLGVPDAKVCIRARGKQSPAIQTGHVLHPGGRRLSM